VAAAVVEAEPSGVQAEPASRCAAYRPPLPAGWSRTASARRGVRRLIRGPPRRRPPRRGPRTPARICAPLGLRIAA